MNPLEPGQPVESRDVKGGPTFVVALSFVILAVLLATLVWWLFSSRLRIQKEDYQSFSTDSFPRPRVQTAPVTDLLTLRAKEDEILLHYRWKDAAHTQAEIPIERAMQILIEKRKGASHAP
jgi:hypothetical protein